MPIARIIAFSSALPLAVGGYVVYYCLEKARYASGSTVGDDIIVIGYFTTVTTMLFSSLAIFMTRNEARGVRALPAAALIVDLGALTSWLWLHLSGVVVPYSSVMKP